VSRIQTVYVVVRSDGEIRVAKRPRLNADEIAIALTLHFPDGWGRVTQNFTIEMPEPPVADEPAEVATDG
jgi:hypothetical protein